MLYPLSYGGGPHSIPGDGPARLWRTRPPRSWERTVPGTRAVAGTASPRYNAGAAGSRLAAWVPVIPDPLSGPPVTADVLLRAAVSESGPLPMHLLPDTAGVGDGGQLTIGGVDVLEIVEQLGTPVFIYDEQHLRARCREARQAFGPRVAYTSKAFLCKAMAALAHEEGCCLDVSTGGELAVALAASVPPDRLVMHGNNKAQAELEEALAAGVGRLVVDNFDEIDRLAGLGARRTGRPAAAGRPGPRHAGDRGSHPRVRDDRSGRLQVRLRTGLGSRRGGRKQAAPRFERRAPGRCAPRTSGPRIFALESFSRALEVLAPFFGSLELEELCIGGGLGVPYVTGEAAPSISGWAAALRQAARSAGIDDAVALSAEPGRSIVAAAAITCYTVGTVKELPGLRTYVSVDGGMSDNPRPVLYGSGYEAFLPREVAAQRPRLVSVVGKHCESGDVVVRDAGVPADLAVGDVLATPVTGAYGHSMASNYNKVPRPPVVFVTHGQWRTVVRRETYQDLLALDA